jgi:hypothetical protein
MGGGGLISSFDNCVKSPPPSLYAQISKSTWRGEKKCCHTETRNSRHLKHKDITVENEYSDLYFLCRFTSWQLLLFVALMREALHSPGEPLDS